MEENEKKEEKQKDIKTLLRLRSELDDEIEKKFTKEIVVMFTDIYESTAYFQSSGDFDGRLMIQKHNDLLFPIIATNKGKVIKTIGDAIMALFETPEHAVKAAILMQQKLYDFNQGKGQREQIHIRIGMHQGKGIVEEDDIYGDVVNTAARIEPLAEPDQIVISKPVYSSIKNSEEVICRHFKSSKLKGKTEETELYRVIWTDEEILTSKTRAILPQEEKKLKKKAEAEKVFVLELSRDGEKLKASAYEKTSASTITVRHYEELSISEGDINHYCKEILSLLNKANKQGKLSKEILLKLRDTGQMLYDQLLPLETKKKLSMTKAKSLILNIEDALVQIPWELLYDGSDFLCLKFNIGRIVSTRLDIPEVKIRKVERPLKILILADPKGDLNASYEEGVKIKNLLAKEELINTTFQSSSVRAGYIKEKLRNFDIVHYAGHSDYDEKNPSNSGWLLTDGKLKAQDLMNMRGSSPFPALVFSNACHSGRTEEWRIDEKYEQRIYGIASAFLLSGVHHYIGTFWEVMDESSSKFATTFYQELLKGASIGEAVRSARQSLIDTYGEETIVWASYMLYGDPEFKYIDVAEEGIIMEEEEEPQNKEMFQQAQMRGEGERISSYFKIILTSFLVLFFLTAVIFGIYFSKRITGVGEKAKPQPAYNAHSKEPSSIYLDISNKAFLLEKEGKVEEAVALYKKALEANPEDEVGKILLANAEKKLHFATDKESQGKIDSLVKDLIAQYEKKRKVGGVSKERDLWSSKPITATFIDFESKGEKSKREGENEFLVLAITNALQENGRLRVVEREALDKLLHELKLSQTDLADRDTALRVGKILSAKLISTGSIMRFGDEIQVSLRMIETDTSSIKFAFAESFSKNTSLGQIAKEISKKINQKIAKEFPLRGEVSSVSKEGEITLNIGSAQGVKQGLQMRAINSTGVEVGKIEVTNVFEKSSTAKILSGKEKIKKGTRIIE